MNPVESFFDADQKLREYFEYQEGWQTFPFDDNRDKFWGMQGGAVYYSDSKDGVALDDDGYLEAEYEFDVYKSRHVKQSVYRKEEYTLVIVDIQTDRNILAMIFDNSKELKAPE